MIPTLRNVLFGLCLLTLSSCQGQDYGMASYYSNDLDGRETAYGDIYDKDELTAASNTHPYGTLLRVTRLDTKASVIVKVIDKGPYAEGRIIDLSYAAARELNMLDDGVVEVKVEVHQRSREAPPTANPLGQRNDGSLPVRRVEAGEPNANTTTARAPGPVNTPPGQVSGSAYARQRQESDSKYGLYRIQLEHTPPEGFGVQVQVITDYAMVIKRIADLQAQHFDDGILLSVEPGPDRPLYKLMLGPFDTRAAAETYQANLRSRYDIVGFVVDFSEKDYTPPGDGG